MTVTDTGHGMDEATRRRALEPFFTTKPEGKGTGLGLATVYGMVKQSGGELEIATSPGAGTTITLYFPHVDESAERPSAEAKTAAVGGDETVLLIEDDDAARDFVAGVLRRAGYRVLEAGVPAHAFELAEAAHIDVLLTDIVLPELGEPAIAAQLRRDRPHLSTLFMSGHVESADDARVVEAGGLFLQKPFGAVELLAKGSGRPRSGSPRGLSHLSGETSLYHDLARSK